METEDRRTGVKKASAKIVISGPNAISYFTGLDYLKALRAEWVSDITVAVCTPYKEGKK